MHSLAAAFEDMLSISVKAQLPVSMASLFEAMRLVG